MNNIQNNTNINSNIQINQNNTTNVNAIKPMPKIEGKLPFNLDKILNTYIEEINLENETYNEITEKIENGIKCTYNKNGHIIRKMKQGRVIYDEYPSGKVKVDNVLGWNLKFNEDGTIHTILDTNSYLWGDKSLYKYDKNGDIIIYDKDDETKEYLKLTKDGKKIELYTKEDYYKEECSNFKYVLNKLRERFPTNVSDMYQRFPTNVSDIETNSIFPKYIRFDFDTGGGVDSKKSLYAAYNKNGDLYYIEYPNGVKVRFNENHVLVESKSTTKYNYKRSGVKYYFYNEQGLLKRSGLYDKDNPERAIESLYDKNTGKLIVDIRLDGTYEKYYENGQLHEEKLSNGTCKYYSKNGQLKKVEKSDGTWEEYYETGQLAGEKLSDGTYKEYYKNGQLKKVEKSDGTYEEYYETGQLEKVGKSDGTWKAYYETGQLKEVGKSDGTFKRYYKTGQLAGEKLSDGTWKAYYETGQLQIVWKSDGSDGTIKFYSETGQLYQVEKEVNDKIKEKYDINTKTLTIYDEFGNIEKIEQNVSYN